MPHTRVRDLELYYEIHGDGEPLLCVMGLGGDISGWRFQLPAWSQAFRVIAFDNRDCGRSSYAAEEYEVRDMATDALALADMLGLERFHLVGISLGGAIAQEVALAAPERLLTLTLIVSYGGGGRWARERARLEIASATSKTEEQLLDEMLLQTFSEATFEQPGVLDTLRAFILSYEHRQRREGFNRQLLAGARHEARERLSRLRMPTHVIGAEQDLLVPVWKSRELARLIPGAKLSVIEGAAHVVNVERAAQLNELVLGFLAGDEGVARPDSAGVSGRLGQD